MNANHKDVQREELAALYAAGALPSDEREAFERMLRTEEEAAEFRSLIPVIEALSATIEEVSPPDFVFEKLMRRVAETPEPSKSIDPGILLKKAEDADWQKTSFPGIERRMLFVDRERRCQTFVLRAAPGAVLPRHPHPMVEECFMLSGDLVSAGVTLHAGDYLRFDANVHHGHSRTVNGCTLLISGALDEDTHSAHHAMAIG